MLLTLLTGNLNIMVFATSIISDNIFRNVFFYFVLGLPPSTLGFT